MKITPLTWGIAYLCLIGPVAVVAVWLRPLIAKLVVVQAGEPLFSDLKVYLFAAQCVSLGQDPYQPGASCLYLGIPSNLMPYLQEPLGYVATARSYAVPAAVLMSVVFLLSLGLLPLPGGKRSDWLQFLAVTSIVLSPAGLLAIAKGNIEQLLISMVLLAIVLTLGTGLRCTTGLLLIAATAITKFYTLPLLVLSLLWCGRRARLLSFGLTLVVLVLVVNWRESLFQILENTPRGYRNSFGRDFGVETLISIVSPHTRHEPPIAAIVFAAAVITAAVTLVMTLVALRTARPRPTVICPAIAGSMIVATAWAVLINWEYRYLWVVLALPLLVRLSRRGRRALRGLFTGMTLMICVTPWTTATLFDQGLGEVLLPISGSGITVSGLVLFLEVASHTLVAGGLAGVCAASCIHIYRRRREEHQSMNQVSHRRGLRQATGVSRRGHSGGADLRGMSY